MSSARFEIVRTDAGWHSRIRAENGRVMWTTEVYTRRRAALNAIVLLHPYAAEDGVLRDVDERNTDLTGWREDRRHGSTAGRACQPGGPSGLGRCGVSTHTKEAQSVRYWLTPAGCEAAGGHVFKVDRCVTCGASA